MSRSVVAFGLVLLAGLLNPIAATAAPDDVVLVSRGLDGKPGMATQGTVESNGAQVSADGRFVLFTSNAPNMGAGVPAGQTQAYVRDLADPGGAPVLVSRADGPNGTPSDNGGVVAGLDAHGGAISADGRYAFFGAVFGGGGEMHGYRRDLATSRTELVTIGPDGATLVPGGPVYTAGDGRFAVFQTARSPRAIYLRDLIAGRTVLISRATGADGAPTTDDDLDLTGVSPGGRYVAFQSSSPDLTAGPAVPTGARAIYLRDVRFDTTILASRADGFDGAPVGRYVGFTPVSGDGCVVAFDAYGTGIAGGSPGNGGVESYQRDLCAGTTRLVSRTDGTAGAAAITSPGPMSADVYTQGMSADGRYVLFAAETTNLVSGVHGWQVYVRDVEGGRTLAISRDTGNTGHFGNAAMTPDAAFVAFSSKGTGLIAEDTGDMGQIYRRELGPLPAGAARVTCGSVDDPGIGEPAAAACPSTATPPPATPSPTPSARPIPVPVSSDTPVSPTAPIVAATPTLIRAPTLRSVQATKSKVSAWVDLPATVEVRIARAAGGRWRGLSPVRRTTVAKAGAVRVALPRLGRARYRLTVRALGTAGSRSAAVTRTLDLRRTK